MKIDDNLSQVFNMEPIERLTGEIVDATTGEIIESADSKIESDYDKRASAPSLL
jgi:hypothetical protein